MVNSKVFVFLIEIRTTLGCQLDPEEILGAAVRCYVPANSQEQAHALLMASLLENKFVLTEIEWCVQHDLVEWENPGDETGAMLIAEALETGDVAYGEFHVWGHDAPDA